MVELLTDLVLHTSYCTVHTAHCTLHSTLSSQSPGFALVIDRRSGCWADIQVNRGSTILTILRMDQTLKLSHCLSSTSFDTFPTNSLPS